MNPFTHALRQLADALDRADLEVARERLHASVLDNATAHPDDEVDPTLGILLAEVMAGVDPEAAIVDLGLLDG